MQPPMISYPLPPESIQVRFTGLSGDATMHQAQAFYDVVKSYARSPAKVLDFGCGWGRITRCALKHVGPEKVTGCDCMEEMVKLCNETLPCKFHQNMPLPPSPFEDNSFDLIYGYSVFSHLSEKAAAAWIDEFYRILMPDSFVVITTRERAFLPNLANTTYFPPGIDPSVAERDYDAGKFVHYATGGGPELSSDFYGETAIPRLYVEQNWKQFELVAFMNVPGVDQNIIVLKS